MYNIRLKMLIKVGSNKLYFIISL